LVADLGITAVCVRIRDKPKTRILVKTRFLEATRFLFLEATGFLFLEATGFFSPSPAFTSFH
jgi:hypothetical protein